MPLESSGLFWYKLVFLAELLIAETLFLVRLKRRKYFIWRLLACLGVCFAVTWFFPLPVYNFAYTSLMFLVIFAVTVPCQKFCFEESWITLIFCSVAAYSTQHMAYQLYTILLSVFGLAGEGTGIYDQGSEWIYNIVTAMIYIRAYFAVYWFVTVFYALKIDRNNVVIIKNLSLFLLLGLCALVNVLINAIVTYNSYEYYNMIFVVMAGISSIVCCVLQLTLQFKLLLQCNLEDKLDKAYHLIRQEQKQYELSKANIDLVNLKCHDLKHQIRKIGQNVAINENALKEIEEVINIYDSAIKTGNDVLDTILTEKSLVCNKNHISLTCVADGARLNFIDEIDLYTLFGNIFDNAIEAVLLLDEEKRAIGFTTKLTGDLFSLNIRNFYKDEIIFADGLPQTIKADKEYHGFGMKSIKRIVEKYKGDLLIDAANGIFDMNILFDLSVV